MSGALKYAAATPLPLLAACAALALVPGCGGSSEPAAAEPQVLRIAYPEDPDFDPASPGEYEDWDFQRALFETLTTLGDRLEPVPALAERWEVSDDGLTFTFHLRRDGRWTNGEPVTAHDFEWSWKRALAPETESAVAASLFRIAGAEDYSACTEDCTRLRDAVGVLARGERLLEVRLAAPRPWFAAEVAQQAYAAVHRQTVERYRSRWTDPRHIVTNGPYRLAAAQRGRRTILEKWEEWRGSGEVTVDRVEVHVQPDADDRLRAFSRGEIDVAPMVTPTDRLAGSRFAERYPLLGVAFLQLNTRTIRDPLQRRAMALALEDISGADPQATSLVPMLASRDDTLAQAPDLERARSLMARVTEPRRRITLWYLKGNRPGLTDARAVQRSWRALGIETELRGLDPDRYYAGIGEPMPETMDVRPAAWLADYPDAMAFLELFTCGARWNVVHYCDRRYDALVERAPRIEEAAARARLYRELEATLTGPEGTFPVIPTVLPVVPFLESDRVRSTFTYPQAPIGIDFTAVRPERPASGD